jgi:hypothetical protein
MNTIKEILAMAIMAAVIIWAFQKANELPIVIKDVEGKVCFCITEQTKFEPGPCDGVDMDGKYDEITWQDCQEREE